MASDTAVCCYTKKFKKISQGHICVVFEGKADLKTIRDENDVLTDDELVVVRGILRKSKHACLYIRNEFPRGFRLLIHV